MSIFDWLPFALWNFSWLEFIYGNQPPYQSPKKKRKICDGSQYSDVFKTQFKKFEPFHGKETSASENDNDALEGKQELSPRGADPEMITIESNTGSQEGLDNVGVDGQSPPIGVRTSRFLSNVIPKYDVSWGLLNRDLVMNAHFHISVVFVVQQCLFHIRRGYFQKERTRCLPLFNVPEAYNLFPYGPVVHLHGSLVAHQRVE